MTLSSSLGDTQLRTWEREQTRISTQTAAGIGVNINKAANRVEALREIRSMAQQPSPYVDASEIGKRLTLSLHRIAMPFAEELLATEGAPHEEAKAYLTGKPDLTKLRWLERSYRKWAMKTQVPHNDAQADLIDNVLSFIVGTPGVAESKKSL